MLSHYALTAVVARPHLPLLWGGEEKNAPVLTHKLVATAHAHPQPALRRTELMLMS